MSTYKALVFEGGGSAALAYVGALTLLQKEGLLQHITHFAGSSSGAIYAAALGCGVSIPEITQTLHQTKTKLFLDHTNVIGDLCRLYKKYGWYKGLYLEKWFGDFLAKYAGCSELTFAQAFAKTGKTLVITAVDMTSGTVLYMSHQTTPDLMIKEAVRRSTAVPILFCPVASSNNLFLDGGLLDNYPMQYMEETFFAEQKRSVLGLKLLSTQDFHELAQCDDKVPTNLGTFTLRILQMLYNKNWQLHVPNDQWVRTIKIDIGDHPPFQFELSDDQEQLLIDAGQLGVEKWIEVML
jgi:NTE family protein